MQYELITDPLKCQELFDHLEFSIFKSYNSLKPIQQSLILNNHELFFQQFMIEKNQIKSNRHFLIFNSIQDGKTREEFKAPRTVMIDFDHLNEEQTQNIYNQLIRLPSCMYCDYSQSNKGVKALFNVYNDYTFDYYFVSDESECGIETELFEQIHYQNFTVVKEYLKDNGVDINMSYNENGKIRKHLDPAGGKITQGTYTSNGEHFYFNPLPAFLTYRFKKYSYRKPEIPINVQLTKNKNDIFLAWFVNSYNGVNNKKEFHDILDAKFEHQIDFAPFLNVLKHIKDERILEFFYQIIKNAYQGKKLKRILISFYNFKNYVKNHKGFTKYVLDAEIYLSDLKRFFKSDTLDLFENRFNMVVKFETYLTEQKEILFEAFNENKTTVIRSKPGTGKTSLLHQYIISSFKKGMKIIVFTIPKNSLNTQQFKKINDLFKNTDIKVVRNFEGNDFDSKNYNGEKVLIISSTPRLKNIVSCDLLILDEIQNFVFYSKVISSNINTRFEKLICLSATPEPYLIGLTDYYYINCVNNSLKDTVNLVYGMKHKAIFEKVSG